MIKQVAVEDLWPGDIIDVPYLGSYVALRCQFRYAEQDGNMVRVHLSTPGRDDLEALADSWKDSVKFVG